MSKLSSFTYDVKREIKEIEANKRRIEELEKENEARRNEMLSKLHQLEKIAGRVAQEFLNNDPGAVWMSNFVVAVVGPHQEIKRLGNGNTVVLVPCNFLQDKDEKTVDGWLEELLPQPEPEQLALDSFIESVDLPQEEEVDEDDIPEDAIDRLTGYEAVPEGEPVEEN